MSYMTVGTENDPRPQLDIKAFATDLAAAMGGKVPPNEDDYNAKIHAEIAFSNYVIGLTAGWQNNKVSVSISPTGIKRGHANPHGDKYKLPRINVSVERPISNIAADIVRRLIEPAAAPIAERRKYSAGLDQAASDLRSVGAKLQAALPWLKITIKEGETYAGTIYANSPHEGPYLSGRFYANGSVSIDHLGSLTAEQFEKLTRAIYSE